MFEFDGKKTALERELEEEKQRPSVTLGTFLSNIEHSNYGFYDSLSDDEKKTFVPYTGLRMVSSLDDSMAVTFKASEVEAIFGKWAKGAKEALNELREELNQTIPNGFMSVSKYEHAKYDWRIKFSVLNNQCIDVLKKTMSEMGIQSRSVESMVSRDTAQFQLMLLNDWINDGMWDMQKHPELSYRLMCGAQSVLGETNLKPNWLPFCKGMKTVNREIFEVMRKQLTGISACQFNIEEYKILLANYSEDEFKQILYDMGNEQSTVKSLMKNFKSEVQKYVKGGTEEDQAQM